MKIAVKKMVAGEQKLEPNLLWYVSREGSQLGR
jgi:hypothetical protein